MTSELNFLILILNLTPHSCSTMTSKQQLEAIPHAFVLLLITVIPLAAAQSLRLVYIGRSGSYSGANRVFLECRRNSIAVLNPQIWVERSGLPRQQVTIVDHRNGQVTIEITQDLEGLYSCSDNGRDRSNRLDFVGKNQNMNWSLSMKL